MKKLVIGVKLAAIGIQFMYHDTPKVLDGVQVQAIRGPMHNLQIPVLYLVAIKS